MTEWDDKPKPPSSGGTWALGKWDKRVPLVVLLLSVTAAVVLGRIFWPDRNSDQTLSSPDNRQSDLSRLDDDEVQFAGPAFSPNATDEDLENAAQEAVQVLLQRFPQSPDALHVFARLQYGLGRRAEAMTAWERCLELAPDHAEAFHGLSQSAFARADFEAAGKWSGQWLALNQRDPRAQAMLAESLLKQNQLEPLVAVLGPIFLQAELSPDAGVPLGLAYLQLQRFEDAERVFQAVLGTAAVSPAVQKRAHYGLATVYLRQGRSELARTHRERFQQISDVDLSATRDRIRLQGDGRSIRMAVETHNECGRVYSDQGDLAAAEEAWRKAAALSSDDVESRTQLAALYEKTNRERQALRRCEQLRDLQPDNPDHWLNVGLLNARLYRFDLARQAVSKAIELNPDEPRYRHAYQAIPSPP
jgi:tetratricopeptide (TPR) repeat protein